MDLATSWYYRYVEKEEQMEKIDKQLLEFEQWIDSQVDKGEKISVAELQRAWNKSVHI